MKHTTRVNLHSHSIFSDGELTPEALVEKLAAAGICYAALTDHDSIDGLSRFHEALKRRNIGHITGVELTTWYQGREAHLLAYGFDAGHAELKATLAAMQKERFTGVQSIAGPLRKMATHHVQGAAGELVLSVAASGQIEIADAIALIHRAGGKTFLAHPLLLEPDPLVLDDLLIDLKAKGLDGLEALYEPFLEAEQKRLSELAGKHGLMICAGTDFHAASGADKSALWVDMPTEYWKQLTRSICCRAPAALLQKSPPEPQTSQPVSQAPARARAFLRPYFVMRIIFPSLLAIALFVAAIWGVILPSFERILIERKRDTIMELTNSALSILASFERDERSGRISRKSAQEMAKSRIEALRYGKDGKDYFWLQDLHPHVIMHPYRPDLNGQDVSGFTDPRGVRIFVEFADLVRRKQAGYVEYVWQWKDDPGRLEAKESYVSGFAPWGWVIGTGIYSGDVYQEIKRIERNLVHALLVISAVVIFWLLYTVHQSLAIERERLDMEDSLRDSTQRYRSLVEATTEGTLLVIEGRCRYANPTMLQMLGYSPDQLELLDLTDLLPREAENDTAWDHILQLTRDSRGSRGFEALLQRSDGKKLERIITLNPMSFAGHAGFILLAKDVFPGGGVKRESDREALIEMLQASLLFLHEPIGRLGRKVVTCRLETPIHQVASLMTEHDTSAVVVTTNGNAAVGFVTDHDLRERVLKLQTDPGTPVRTVMSAPLVAISEQALIYEALMRIEESKRQHLAVEDENRKIVSVICAKDLIKVHRYGPAVLTRGIARAGTPEDVARWCKRVPALVKALVDSGARSRNITHMISSVCDAAAQRFIAMAMDELGPPPGPFSFIAMGSHGRKEQTLVTDQDNAIIFASRAHAPSSDYFLALGAKVCEWLNRAGYPLCLGRAMASNPRWCQPLVEWKQYFADWIRKAEPQELLEFSIFFDFRTVHGEVEPALELRAFIDQLLEGQPHFLPYLAQNALLFKPPFRLFRKIYLSGGSDESAGQLNLKDALMPLVGFARLYALRHHIHHTHSLERIEDLVVKNALSESTRDAIGASYDFLMRLRLQRQSSAIQAGRQPDNMIHPGSLGNMEEAMLKQAFAQIATVQKKIIYDFLGGAQWQGN
jgi:PAS domain S-box-containing protein